MSKLRSLLSPYKKKTVMVWNSAAAYPINFVNKTKKKIRETFDYLRGATISKRYLEMNQTLHENLENYGTSSSKWADIVLFIYKCTNSNSVLDYGCGKALLQKNLPQEIHIQNYDPAIPMYNAKPNSADLVVCSDVLEHIEPHLLSSLLKDLSRLTKKSSFLVISCRPAKKILSDGRNAHLIQEDENWWMNKIKNHFSFVQLIHKDNIQKEIVIVCGPTQEDALGPDAGVTSEKLRELCENIREKNFVPAH